MSGFALEQLNGEGASTAVFLAGKYRESLERQPSCGTALNSQAAVLGKCQFLAVLKEFDIDGTFGPLDVKIGNGLISLGAVEIPFVVCLAGDVYAFFAEEIVVIDDK